MAAQRHEQVEVIDSRSGQAQAAPKGGTKRHYLSSTAESACTTSQVMPTPLYDFLRSTDGFPFEGGSVDPQRLVRTHGKAVGWNSKHHPFKD